jgi:hypothetical protein
MIKREHLIRGNIMVDGISSSNSSYSAASSATLIANRSAQSSAQDNGVAAFKAQVNTLTQQLSNTSISVSSAFLEKMAADPEMAAKGKELLDGLPAAHAWLENSLRTNGMKLVSSGVMIDADGNMSSWGVSQTDSGPDTNSLLDGAKDKTNRKKVTGEKADDAWQANRNLFASMGTRETTGLTASGARGIDILV